MKIIQLTAENVKRLTAVEIRPDPESSVVIIGGANGAGKTCVLDSVEMGLAGRKSIPGVPVRRGENKARIVVELDDLVVKRIFTKKGTELKVTTKEGVPKRAPQTILDGMVGELTFDPQAFMREEPKKQLETLRNLMGLDFTDLEEKRDRAYAARTALNREIKSLQSRVDAMKEHPQVPEKEISQKDLLAELRKAQDTNTTNQAIRGSGHELKRTLAAMTEKTQALSDQITELETYRAKIETQARLTQKQVDEHKKTEATLEDMPTQPIEQQIEAAEDTNRKIRENGVRRALKKDLKKQEGAAEDLSKEIEDCDKEKTQRLAQAKMPVANLGFEGEEVTLNGLPLSQASSAEQLRVSVAMCAALNPTLRVMLIRDGSLLDAHSLKIIADMAAETDSQVWIERVGEGDESAVIIEDGHVKGQDDG